MTKDKLTSSMRRKASFCRQLMTESLRSCMFGAFVTGLFVSSSTSAVYRQMQSNYRYVANFSYAPSSMAAHSIFETKFYFLCRQLDCAKLHRVHSPVYLLLIRRVSSSSTFMLCVVAGTASFKTAGTKRKNTYPHCRQII